MAFQYKTIRLSDLPSEYSKALALAIDMLPDLPLILLRESNPNESNIEKSSHITGYCFNDGSYVVVVCRELSSTIKTLFHEAEHLLYHVEHLSALQGKYGWEKLTSAQKSIIETIIEPEADQAGDEGLNTFKSTYPDQFEKGETASIKWLTENNFSEYNSKQKRTPEDILTDWNLSLVSLKKMKQ